MVERIVKWNDLIKGGKMITFSLIMKVIGIFMMVMIILWFLGWLKLCREYRFSEGYDR